MIIGYAIKRNVIKWNSRDRNGLNIGPNRQKKIERKIVNIFLSFGLILCFGCSKEPPKETVLLSTHSTFFG